MFSLVCLIKVKDATFLSPEPQGTWPSFSLYGTSYMLMLLLHFPLMDDDLETLFTLLSLTVQINCMMTVSQKLFIIALTHQSLSFLSASKSQYWKLFPCTLILCHTTVPVVELSYHVLVDFLLDLFHFICISILSTHFVLHFYHALSSMRFCRLSSSCCSQGNRITRVQTLCPLLKPTQKKIKINLWLCQHF